MEGAIPDAISKRIVEREIIPRFKQNDYYEGIDAATDVLMALATGEYSSRQYSEGSGKKDFGFLVPFIVMLIIFILINRNKNDHYTGGGKGKGSSLPFWTALWLSSTMGGRGGGGGGGGAGGSW